VGLFLSIFDTGFNTEINHLSLQVFFNPTTFEKRLFQLLAQRAVTAKKTAA
jgi:hypothetical protein